MIYFNNTSAFTKVYFGNNEFTKVYSSDALVWSKTTPPTPTAAKFSATYAGGATYSAECDGSSELTTATTKPSGYEFSSMTSAVIGDCITSVKGFQRCTSLTSVTIPDSVTTIASYAFNICTSLSSITIPNSVTTISYTAFERCTSLTSVTIPDSVTSIGVGAFNDCSGLTSVNIGSGVTVISGNAFDHCNSLTSITVEATTPPTLGSGAFNNTNNAPIYVPCNSVEAYKSAWSTYASRIEAIPNSCAYNGKVRITYYGGQVYEVPADGNTSLTEAEITGGPMNKLYIVDAQIGTAVTSIGGGAFGGCSNMSSVTISDTVTTIGYGAFGDCSGLTSVTIPDSVTNISGGVFTYCTNLTSVNLPSGITSIGTQFFMRCSSLTSITIPDSVTSIGGYAFEHCSSLTSVNLPSGITSIGADAFRDCSGLTSVTCNAITPPSGGGRMFDGTNNCPIYVPAISVNAYKNASGWWNYPDRIQAIP